MDRFITKKPTAKLDPKKTENNAKSKEPEEKENGPTNKGSATPSSSKSPFLFKNKAEDAVPEKSGTEILHEAMREDDAKLAYDMLSRNRPFDRVMRKTMSKMMFSDTFSSPSSHFMMLQVDEDVAKGLVEGQRISIRGEKNDDAVLCTEDKTYPIKMMESSTTYLFSREILHSPGPNSPDMEAKFDFKEISGRSYAIGELCPPCDVLNVGRLKDLLHEHQLTWNWRQHENGDNMGYAMRDLLKLVQMSVGELEIALTDLPVVKLGGVEGKLRYMSHKYRGELLGCVVEAIDDDSKPGVSMEQIDRDALRESLPTGNVPDEVVDWYLKTRCDMVEDDVFTINKRMMVRDLTTVVLNSTRKMPLDQFQELIHKILPFGVDVKKEYMDGICNVSDSHLGKQIEYLSTEDLPDDLKDRMLYLLEVKKLWSMEELRPFFGDLFKNKVSFDKFLVQRCNYTLSDDGKVLYCGVNA